MKIEKDVALGPKTTFRIGGLASHYVEVVTVEELKAAIAYASVRNLAVFVLGGGSNILVSDEGFNGLVIKNNIRGISYDEYPQTTDVTIFAGEVWDDVVADAVQRNLRGIENLSLIPGSFGGAIAQNIGAYGTEIKEVVQWVDVVDLRNGQTERFSDKDCQFEYRNTFFKSNEGKNFIIVSATLRLKKNTEPTPTYKDLVEYLAKRSIPNPSLKDVRDAVIEIRTSKLPDIAKIGTVGSFFKNIIISKDQLASLQEKYSEIPSFPQDGDKVKVPLAWIIDKVCGLKGYRQGDAGIYEKQAIVLVNYGSATQKDIDALAGYIARSVFDKTGLVIEREAESIG